MALNLDSTLRLDKELTTLATGYVEGICPELEQIAPEIKVPLSGQYPSYAKGAWYFGGNARRAPGETKSRIYIPPYESWNAYVLETHELIAFIDEQHRDREGIVQGMVYSDPKVAAKKLADMLTQEKHKIIADLIKAMSATYYATPSVKWDADGATPFDNIWTWIRTLRANCGMGPNKLMIPTNVFSYFGDAARASYNVTALASNKEIVQEKALVDLGIPKDGLLIPDATYHDGTSFTDLMSDNVVLARVAKDPSLFEPTFMGVLVPKDEPHLQVYTPFETEHKTGWYLKVKMQYLVKILDNYAGYMGKDVLA